MKRSLGKTDILRSHLEAAIALVSFEEFHISAHTIIMAAEELFRNLYVKKNLPVLFDYRIYIKDEHQKEYLAKAREKFNFFKHADRDTDEIIEIDKAEMHKLNEMMLGILVAGWRNTFPETSSATMDVYAQWFPINYPDLIRWEKIAGGEKLKENIEKLDTDLETRRQMLRVMLYNANLLPRDDFTLLSLMERMGTQ